MRNHDFGMVMALALTLAACAGHPNDSALESRFRAHRHAFVALASMAEEDSQLTRIAPDFTWLVEDVSWPRPNVGLSPERWDSYRALFKETGASHGVFRRQGAPGVFLIASAEGIAGRGSSKGYV